MQVDRFTHPTKRDRLNPGSARPYVVVSENDLMGIRADMRALGAVTANEERVSERWKSSGTKSGPCMSIFPDGSVVPFTRTRKGAATRLAAVRTSKVDHGTTYFDKLAQLGADGDQNH